MRTTGLPRTAGARRSHKDTGKTIRNAGQKEPGVFLLWSGFRQAYGTGLGSFA
ncbi:hypothetical protein JM93_01710 [Roseibium hamelinense]|uniref:Uncharacterized protein n=1 Tax=Roseibium hamelinense TaxID=150831 RepID=A0A562T7E5_9HYPH|nr:hypothetical protein JM93_01710 [Roseibium hamelinense]